MSPPGFCNFCIWMKYEWKMRRKEEKNALHNNLISFLLCLHPRDNVCCCVRTLYLVNTIEKKSFVLIFTLLSDGYSCILQYYYENIIIILFNFTLFNGWKLDHFLASSTFFVLILSQYILFKSAFVLALHRHIW